MRCLNHDAYEHAQKTKLFLSRVEIMNQLHRLLTNNHLMTGQ